MLERIWRALRTPKSRLAWSSSRLTMDRRHITFRRSISRRMAAVIQQGVPHYARHTSQGRVTRTIRTQRVLAVRAVRESLKSWQVITHQVHLRNHQLPIQTPRDVLISSSSSWCQPANNKLLQQVTLPPPLSSLSSTTSNAAPLWPPLQTTRQPQQASPRSQLRRSEGTVPLTMVAPDLPIWI